MRSLIGNLTVDLIEFSNRVKIIKILAPSSMNGMSVDEIDSSYPNIRAVAYKTQGEWCYELEKKHIIQEGDMLSFIGDKKSIDEFSKVIL